MILEHKKIYTAYAERDDITFIMEEKYNKDGEITSTTVVGWHYGKPDRKITPNYIRELTATY